jgi:hypothetical protein
MLGTMFYHIIQADNICAGSMDNNDPNNDPYPLPDPRLDVKNELPPRMKLKNANYDYWSSPMCFGQMA